MIKVFIVDDEMLVRVGLKMMIDWQSNGIEIIGEASNGREALGKITATNPDIIITDLKMPVMDGVTLIKELKQTGFRGKIIVLSNYNEFELVKEAMKNGASDYLLKVTLNGEDLVKLIHTLSEDLEKQEQKGNVTVGIKIELNENRNLILEKFINDVINKNISRQEIVNKISIHNMNISFENYIIMMVINDFCNVVSEFDERDKDLFYFSIYNMAGEVINRRSKGEIFHYKDSMFLILLNASATENAPDGYFVKELCKEISIIQKRYLDIETCYIYKHEPVNIGEVDDMMDWIMSKQQLKFYINEVKFIDDSISLKLSDEIDSMFWKMKDELKEALEIYREKVRSILNNIFLHISEKKYNLELIKQITRNLITLIEDTAIKGGCDIYRILSRKDVDSIQFSSSLELLKKRTQELYSRAVSYFDMLEQNRIRDDILKAVDYIKRNYTQKISLDDVACYVNISKNYFCKVFKEEMGVSPGEYIIKFKMEKAKEYLISTEMNVSEVAKYLSYDNIPYFNRLFKKYMGSNPGFYK